MVRLYTASALKAPPKMYGKAFPPRTSAEIWNLCSPRHLRSRPGSTAAIRYHVFPKSTIAGEHAFMRLRNLFRGPWDGLTHTDGNDTDVGEESCRPSSLFSKKPDHLSNSQKVGQSTSAFHMYSFPVCFHPAKGPCGSENEDPPFSTKYSP
ncbi:hypothetical protein BDZ94DRAFT_813560 [Collybia nuda]|uniref:Uncharacterized protein n=1 Tax=Collybia nuda TaxID=64659 RepID=A0A9P5Y374_9AGAR|nr:hypothetical protein BDZ94DRAFT_813560 [Collybia nuda]